MWHLLVSISVKVLILLEIFYRNKYEISDEITSIIALNLLATFVILQDRSQHRSEITNERFLVLLDEAAALFISAVLVITVELVLALVNQ